MPDRNGIAMAGHAIRRTLLLWALPRLDQFEAAEWEDVQRRASETDFDFFEWGGVLAGVVFVTYLMRFSPDQATLPLPLLYVIQFVAAVPLLLLAVGPFYLRNMRRGLDQEIERRRACEQTQRGGYSP